MFFLGVQVNFCQNKSILVYTLKPEAEFIPFVNGQKMSMIPVDSFYFEADTLEFVELYIHFLDKKTSDLKKTIDFNMIKNKKYEIVYKSKILRKINEAGTSEKADTLYDKFRIKNHSFTSYLGEFGSGED